MAKIGGNGAGAEITGAANDGVSAITQMPDFGAGADDAVFDFHGIADITIIANRSIASNQAIRAESGFFPDDDIAIDVSAAADD